MRFTSEGDGDHQCDLPVRDISKAGHQWEDQE